MFCGGVWPGEAAAAAAGDAGAEGASEESLRVRSVEAYFPFHELFLGSKYIGG